MCRAMGDEEGMVREGELVSEVSSSRNRASVGCTETMEAAYLKKSGTENT